MKRILTLGFFLTSVFIMSQALAAVYKWVDEEGNVHFSDKPQDAEKGEQVDVDSVNVMEGGEQFSESAARNRERVLERQKKLAEATQDAPDPCEADVEKYRALTGVKYDANGKPFYYYMNNEDGSPMSETDHRKMIEELGKDLKKRGCI